VKGEGVRKGVWRGRGSEGREDGREKGCPVFLDNNVGNPRIWWEAF